MKENKLRQLEIRISDTTGTSYRTVVDFEQSLILRSGVMNHEKVDLQPAVLNELEKTRLIEKLSHLNISTLKNSRKSDGQMPDLYWQVIISGDEVIEEVGIDQLPEEWGQFFRLLS
ncbi:hypothetical protein [Jeotgalibacillus sp. JSM ZJ347]|uniref:hypothetical protein n=1 Tax=Jeotgalibacillus sp. JSM ZJ347 TaxID=3342117 RepID=UPI0035A9414E